MTSALATLLGGIGLFLLGMTMLTDGLKVTAGPALRTLLERWTRSAPRGLFAGMLITALVQSSTAVTVAIVGFVNAGLLNLSQAIWVVFGANIGTTMTAWLVALVGVKLDMGALALPMLGAGTLLAMAASRRERLAGLGHAIAGFGLFFLGIALLQQGFAGITEHVQLPTHWGNGPLALLAFAGTGVILTTITQSSSAAVAITLTAASAGSITLLPAAAVVIGTNIGTTSTSLFAVIRATPAARRVALAHVVFNLMTGAVALLMLPWILEISLWISGAFLHNPLPATVLAVLHTLFNLLGVLLIYPLAPRLTHWLSGLFVQPDEDASCPRYLDRTLAEVPALARRGLLLEVARMAGLLFGPAREKVADSGTPDMAVRHEALLELGRAIRAFIADVSTRRLPEEDVGALADGLRAIQHLEDGAEAARLINPVHRRDGGSPALWSALSDQALSALELLPGGPAYADAIIERRTRLEDAYEALKADLLQAAARGAITPDALDKALDEAQAIRSVARSGLKAQRRFLRWVPDGEIATLA